MTEGFFSSAELKKTSSLFTRLAPLCGKCGLSKECKSPKMPVTGNGRRGVLIVAEAPGETEDDEGVQLVGSSGKRLRRHLREIGVSLDEDCWKTNAVICCPGRNPNETEIECCRPNLMRAIKELKPRMIIPLGKVAVKSLIAPLWKTSNMKISRWAGWQIPCQQLNTWICPTYHPSFVLREKNEKGEAAEFWFCRHLESAFELEGRPFDEVPDYAGQVEILMEDDDAVRILDRMVEKGGPIAFDYETNCLKPDSSESSIVSCGVSWKGKKTIAYPWTKATKEATGRLLKSGCPKIAANLKFEERWTRAKLGHGVRNWKLDTMVLAHVLDSRRGITSVKFQSFVRLGQPQYDEEVKPFFRETGGNAINRIDRISWKDLLLYNGLDALLEYKIAKQQMEELGMEL